MEKKVLGAMKKAGKPVWPRDLAKMIGEDSKEVSKIMSSLKQKAKLRLPNVATTPCPNRPILSQKTRFLAEPHLCSA